MIEDDDTKERIMSALRSGKPTKETLSEKPELAQSLFKSMIAIQPDDDGIKALSDGGVS